PRSTGPRACATEGKSDDRTGSGSGPAAGRVPGRGVSDLPGPPWNNHAERGEPLSRPPGHTPRRAGLPGRGRRGPAPVRGGPGRVTGRSGRVRVGGGSVTAVDVRNGAMGLAAPPAGGAADKPSNGRAGQQA